MATYACTDFHGYYDAYQEIKNFIKPNDKVIFLGDACDRGRNGWKLIKAIYEDPQFIYLKGNHEDLLATAFEDKTSMKCWNQNGNAFTKLDVIKDPDRFEWIKKLRALPLSYTYTNSNNQKIVLCHAGFTPNGEMKWADDLMWDRNHYFDKWKDEYEDMIIVHGHTPIVLLHQDLCTRHCGGHGMLNAGAYWYCNGHKVCIDTGVFATNFVTLLNLDTWEEQIFKVED